MLVTAMASFGFFISTLVLKHILASQATKNLQEWALRQVANSSQIVVVDVVHFLLVPLTA